MEQNRNLDDKVIESPDSLNDLTYRAGTPINTRSGILTLKKDMIIGFQPFNDDVEAFPHTEDDVISGIGVAHTKDDAAQDLFESLALSYCAFFAKDTPSQSEEDIRNRLSDLFSLKQ